jgi:hypothetical protein
MNNEVSEVKEAYLAMLRKRFTKLCVKSYFPIFKGKESASLIGEEINKGGLTEPYIFNSQLFEDPFG